MGLHIPGFPLKTGVTDRGPCDRLTGKSADPDTDAATPAIQFEPGYEGVIVEDKSRNSRQV